MIETRDWIHRTKIEIRYPPPHPGLTIKTWPLGLRFLDHIPNKYTLYNTLLILITHFFFFFFENHILFLHSLCISGFIKKTVQFWQMRFTAPSFSSRGKRTGTCIKLQPYFTWRKISRFIFFFTFCLLLF